MVIAAGEAEEDRQRNPSSTATAAAAKAATAAKKYDMEMVPERSRSLHNFSTLPCFNVKWGRQKQLRCVKDSAADQYYPTSSSSPQHHHHHRRGDSLTPDRKRRSAAAAFEDDGGIVAMREKLILDLRTEVHQMKVAILSGDGGGGAGEEAVPEEAAAAEARPWNLRTRRAVCKDPDNTVNNTNNIGNGVGCDRRPSFSPSSRGGEHDGDGGFRLKGPRPKFTASLSKQEIEEDFLAVLGTRPARRPRKRPRYVQKQIGALFPGYWLSEITADMYKVNENPEAGKR